jgi:hypothetical protein
MGPSSASVMMTGTRASQTLQFAWSRERINGVRSAPRSNWPPPQSRKLEKTCTRSGSASAISAIFPTFPGLENVGSGST